MDDIKIFVTHTPNSNHKRIKNPLFYHVMAGSDFHMGQIPPDMLADNTGSNISYKNKSYCELTTQYWAWKNIEADYYGFCHYRRFFSFAPQLLPQADFGCVYFPYLNECAVQKLCLEEEMIRQKVSQYDFLIAKPIPVRALQAESVYAHYEHASQLRIKDLELFCTILCANYPWLQGAVDAYIQGTCFYPCNMFVMKKEVFQAYCALLFPALEEFERKADMRGYSREGVRTPGHLAERFAGIYYVHLKQKSTYRLGELQMAMFGHTKQQQPIPRHPQEIPIVLAANQDYVPILFTCLKSLVNHVSNSREYHIYVFYTDIAEHERQVIIEELSTGQVRIDFVDVGARVAGYRLQAKDHITTETYYRFLLLDILQGSSKVIYLDADTIVCSDLSKLYDISLEGHLLAAVVDPDFAGQYNRVKSDIRRYCTDVLKLHNPYMYIQAGILLLDVDAIRQKTSVTELFRMADQGDYRYSDQDILNIVCQGAIKKLDMAWNMLINSRNQRYEIIQSAPAEILAEYEQARKHPNVIHYAGDSKPWNDPTEDFAQEFWKTARQTPYYEQLLYRMVNTPKKKQKLTVKGVGLLKKVVKQILPQGSRIRQLCANIYWKLK